MMIVHLEKVGKDSSKKPPMLQSNKFLDVHVNSCTKLIDVI